MDDTEIDHGEAEAKRTGVRGRSPEWPAVERAHLAKQPRCTCCAPGTNVGAVMQAHHVFPYHYCVALGRPDLELDERNLVTLCEAGGVGGAKVGENHHLLVGHLDDFRSANLNVVADAEATFQGMSGVAMRGDARWVAEVKGRVKALDGMTAEDKVEFTKRMNDGMPRR
jgi:hypothetical protein